VITKWLATNPKILIVDEPTAGIDVHTKSEIHKLLRKLADSGVSILMISSEMPELLAHSDRVMVMNDGKVLGIFSEITQEEIMSRIMEDIIKNNKTVAES
jgi:ABC-type sugar transport system ATPase subunit